MSVPGGPGVVGFASDMIAAGLAGLVAGVLHVLLGPDHLAALTPLSLRAGRRGWRVGLRWGLGHAAGVAAVAAAAFFLRDTGVFDRLGEWGERAVGATLILLGLWGLRSALRERLRREETRPHAHPHAAFAVGILHGLAGTAHLMGILPVLALPGAAAAGTYFAAFALGTVTAMTAFAGAVGAAAPERTGRGGGLRLAALAAASVCCMLLGTAWILFPHPA